MRLNVQGFDKFLDVAVGARVEIRTQVSFPYKPDAQGLTAEIFASGSRIYTCASEASHQKGKKNIVIFKNLRGKKKECRCSYFKRSL